MDGINPTLAFAALFLGLSGHPRDVAESPVETDHAETRQYQAPSSQPFGSLFDCPGTAIATDGWGTPPASRDFGLFEDHRMALAGSMLIADPGATEASSGPGWLSGEIFHDDDRCGEITPLP